MSMAPPPLAVADGPSSGASYTTTSDVKKVLATDTEFSSAQRITLVGSMMPAFIRFSYTLVAALYP